MGNFIILGTGEPKLHHSFQELKNRFVEFFDASLTYNEKLAHRLYAGCDFLLMPSRVEPCGLNQMYAMRYGTIPVVRTVGGLKDTVRDYSEVDGYGIRFDHFNLDDAYFALQRAVSVFHDRPLKNRLQKMVMSKDFSWHNSAMQYYNLYQELIKEG